MIEIADSNITKRALAAALKELMEEIPFTKISINDICEKCDMNRKSFYYHFKDKYDLINWIFDTEYIAVARKKSYERKIDILVDLCGYFYDNQKFYRNVLQIRGQNSFLEHFHEMLCAAAVVRLEEIFNGQEIPELYINLVADAFVCAIIRWLGDKSPMPPEQFALLIKNYVFGISNAVDQLKNNSGNPSAD